MTTIIKVALIVLSVGGAGALLAGTRGFFAREDASKIFGTLCILILLVLVLYFSLYKIGNQTPKK
ncbi:MAG: hypothetical protein LBU27_00520 [Candidatus Peribacteria bacterium]|jgi:flagellar biogenesis protein FliO|nr:hypothetical protein [Candidatus Peribacteria bacterium]